MTTCCHGDSNDGGNARGRLIPYQYRGGARGPPLRHVGHCTLQTPSWTLFRPSRPPSIIVTFCLSSFMADSFRPRLQSFAGSILSHRVFLYTFASTFAVSATVINALQNHSNFYSVAVYLSKSGASVLVASPYVLSVHWGFNFPLLLRSSQTSACC
jgi:hypothetical protein